MHPGDHGSAADDRTQGRSSASRSGRPKKDEARKRLGEDGHIFGPNGVPILDAYDTGSGERCAVWCAYCGHWHSHGRGQGDRVAHCFDRSSPYRETGYLLREAGVLTEELRESSRGAEREARRRRTRRRR